MRSYITTLLHSLRFGFKTGKNKRIKQLKPAKIGLDNPIDDTEPQQINYLQMKNEINKLNDWQNMRFDSLCNIDPTLLKMLQLQVKKDKFNIPDNEFILSATKTIQLNSYYQRIYALLTNSHPIYDTLKLQSGITTKSNGYLHEMYVVDLHKDKQLLRKIKWFIENLLDHGRLEAVAEPSLVKYLLGLKREIIMQGVPMESQRKKNEEKKYPRPKMIEEEEEEDITSEESLLSLQTQQFNQSDSKKDNSTSNSEPIEYNIETQTILDVDDTNDIKIIKPLNYEYEFWVDVKHNRNRNGAVSDYIIQTRHIPNPNESVLIAGNYPTIAVKYIVRKRKRKQYQMHFVFKADLLIELPGGHQRTVKVQWKGPSNKSTKQQNPQPVQYLIIDYQGLMKGNPTIQPVFNF